MAADDQTTGAEPSLVGRGIGGRAGGALRSGAKKLFNAGRVGARVNVEGIRQANTEFDTMLTKLRSIRVELTAINQLQGGSGGGMGAGGGSTPMGGVGVGTSNPSLSRFSTMTAGFNKLTMTGIGVSAAASAVNAVMGPVTDRFNRNLQESIPISQGNMFIASQYRTNYASMEWDRVKAMGQFNLSRQDTLAAQSIGLAYGQSAAQTNTFLARTVAPLVQASGGTLAPSQAAASASSFLDPMVMRRAQAFGIGQGKIAGQVQNPLTVAMGYIQDYEKRYNIKLNSIDFENLRSPGSPTRYLFKRLYALSDDAIDTVVQAGLQNNTFRSKTGGQNIDFSSGADLTRIGLSSNRLGLKAFQYLTASTRREASFFRTQEGSEVGKLQQDVNIENTLAKVEDALSGIIGPLGEFQRYIKLATGALQGLGALMIAKGLLGGGGFGIPGLGGAGGVGGAGGGVGGVGGGGAVGGGSGYLGAAGVGAAGLAIGIGGTMAGNRMGGGAGLATSVGSGVIGGVMVGGAIGSVVPVIGTGIGAGVGAVIGGVASAATFWQASNAKKFAKNKNAAFQHSMGISDAALIAQLLKSSSKWGNTKGQLPSTDLFAQGSLGATGQGYLRTFETRRAALTAAMLTELNGMGAFNAVDTDTALKIRAIMDFMSQDDGSKYNDFYKQTKDYEKYVAPLISGSKDNMAVYQKYFGNVSSPFALSPVTTSEANGLVMTTADILGSGSDSSTGDPMPGDKSAKGATWDKLDQRMKDRLDKMFAASGGKVWLGNGWRSEDQQKAMFLSRYTPDPSGDVTYQGKKWKRVRGAPAAPPGSSMHEIGLAADLEGDLQWVQANAAKFGLKTFASVNNEPWHVQPAELPNSRSAYEKGGGTSAGGGLSGSADLATTSEAESRPGGGGGWSGPNAVSGVGFSLLNTSPSGGGGFGASTAASSTAGALSSGASTTAGGVLTSEQIAKMAYAAGFRGSALTTIVGIAQRESSNNPAAANESYKNGTGNKKDMSYGLTQINLLPWLEKGQQAPWTPAQLMDPQFNLNTAYAMYQQRGFQPWGIKGNPLANVNMGAAAQAVAAAGYANTGDPMGGGGINIQSLSMSITLQATGQLQYDANMFANAAVARLQDVADTASRRAS